MGYKKKPLQKASNPKNVTNSFLLWYTKKISKRNKISLTKHQKKHFRLKQFGAFSPKTKNSLSQSSKANFVSTKNEYESRKNIIQTTFPVLFVLSSAYFFRKNLLNQFIITHARIESTQLINSYYVSIYKI